jgi:hypothetical protein
MQVRCGFLGAKFESNFQVCTNYSNDSSTHLCFFYAELLSFLGAAFESSIQICIDYSNDSLNCTIKASPKSKAFAPGMARSICMDAGFLCDRAGLYGASHPTISNST